LLVSLAQAEPGHHGRVPEVDDDQLAALRRLRAAFGFVEVIEVISHDPATIWQRRQVSRSRGRGEWRTRGG
jgi:hypothetical protein